MTYVDILCCYTSNLRLIKYNVILMLIFIYVIKNIYNATNAKHGML